MFELTDGREALYQWDTGRTINVDGSCTQLHFSNVGYGVSVDVDVDAETNTAKIPDALLTVHGSLHVYGFIGNSGNGYTKVAQVFDVTPRPKPADYVYTEDELKTYEELEVKIQEIDGQIANLQTEFAEQITNTQNELSGQISDVQSNLSAQIENVHGELSVQITGLEKTQNELENNLSNIIDFPQAINPFTSENYSYTGSNELNTVFTADGFTMSTTGFNESNIYFRLSNLVVGHTYTLSFDVANGEFLKVTMGSFSQNNVSGSFSHTFVAESELVSVRFAIYYTNKNFEVKKSLLIDTDEKTKFRNDNWYKDKKGARFGDSITAQAEFWTSGDLEGSGWSTLVKDYFGCAEIVNCGIGGSTIAGTEVTNAMWTDARINAIPEDCEFILFMGGTNDWGQSHPLGEADSTDTNTFYGALNVIAQKLVTRFPNKPIIWMCNVYGKITTKQETNNAGLSLYDYSRAFIESANRNGIVVIDTFKSWTKYDCEQYLNSESDNTTFIHPNKKGGVRMANIIINGMKNCEPLIN